MAAFRPQIQRRNPAVNQPYQILIPHHLVPFNDGDNFFYFLLHATHTSIYNLRTSYLCRCTPS